MKKICLTLLFLNTIFSAQEENPMQKFKRERMELFSLSSKKISKKHENIVPDIYSDYGIYGDVWNKCESISQTLGRGYQCRLENSDFNWQEKINKNFFKIFFKVSTDQNLTGILSTLAAVVDMKDQQKIADFLRCLNFYQATWTRGLISYQEIRNFFNKFSEVKEFALDGVENIYKNSSLYNMIGTIS